MPSTSGWFPFSLDAETERWQRAVVRAVMAAERERPCRAVVLPSRVGSMRGIPDLRRWVVNIGSPAYLSGAARARALLARAPEVVSCRIERIDSRAVRLAVMTVAMGRDQLMNVVERCLERSGCPGPVQVVEIGRASNDADLR
ncbi:hypothetical protein OO015_10120 [Thermomicrobium sp. 4228-Ro]|uniref:hypothetical protein n=1 Tax=Thermomicrobium sp. 4228-Ro TaxID=2993937 RepID=UPI002249368C|nr:hypothetical protein [Thermomicrobium sp. 4228-Ro]MCX2727843.1 hypothetical protein [Thermomicrobium sp. 4228-Ro]